MTYKIKDEEIVLFGNTNGSFKSNNRTISKFNRVSKIAKDYNKIYSKLIGFLLGKNELKQRLSYACILMLESGIRIGNEKSSEGYTSKVRGYEGQKVQTYGLTTLKPEHIKFENDKLYLDFIGKKLVDQLIEIDNQLLIEHGKRFYELNKDKETWLCINNYELTKFIKKYIGRKFVPKDLRTLTANIKAYKVSKDIFNREKPNKRKEAKAEVREICEKTSEFLGNSSQICKKSYLDKRLLEWHLEERLKK